MEKVMAEPRVKAKDRRHPGVFKPLPSPIFSQLFIFSSAHTFLLYTYIQDLVLASTLYRYAHA